jgi:hypothetical protein
MVRLTRARSIALAAGAAAIVLLVLMAPPYIRIWRTRSLLNGALAAVTQYTRSKKIVFGPTTTPAQGFEVATDLLNRQGTEVDLGRRLLWLARQTPAGRKFWARLPRAQREIPEYAGVSYTPWNPHHRFEPGERVAFFAHSKMLTFTCITRQPDTPDPAAAPPNPAYWIQIDAQPAAPIVLDLWGNPIWFVPAGALSVISANGHPHVVHSPGNRPFFVSAGPDGDFRTGDDNVYSF